MNRIFVDMDGVLVDYQGMCDLLNLDGDQVKNVPRAYANMKPIEGALEAVRELIALEYDVWIATKPPTGVSGAYAEKAEWIFNYLPELERKLIITPDKGMLGDCYDFLIDDRPNKANCKEFDGELIEFTESADWPVITAYLTLRRMRVNRCGT